MPSTTLFYIMFLVARLVICCSSKEVNLTANCISTERNTLLKLKASFSDPYDRLLSWNSSNLDCCKWKGVECDKTTGRVIGLDLMTENPTPLGFGHTQALFSERLDSSILELKHLLFLDLSENDFQLSSIPAFLGSMNQLRHLRLSNANFRGVVPHDLGNLSRLSVLDLSYNGIFQLIVDDILWVTRLSSLKHLDMSFVNLNQTKDVLKVLNMLPHVVDLRLQSSGLENRILQHDCINSVSPSYNIEHLDLSQNSFNGELPCFLDHMTSLKHLDLSLNSYTSCNQPFHLGRLTNIVYLDLSYNSFQCNADRIFEYLSNKRYLEMLDLGDNSFYGDISNMVLLNSSSNVNTLSLRNNHLYGQLPDEIGRFRKLEYLNLAMNLVSGPIPTSMSNLSTLTSVYLSYNKFNGSVPTSFVNLISLKELSLSANQLTGDISIFFGHRRNLEVLFIEENYFYGTISEDHFLTMSKLQSLSFGENLIKLRVGNDWKPPFQLTYFNLKSIDMGGGPFPNWLRTQKELTYLYMSNCRISGPLPNWFPYENMAMLDLSSNSLDGSIPDSLCKMTLLTAVDLSKNRLSGKLPECLANLTMLSSLVLSSNRLSGVIPESIGGAYSLEWLQLSNNSITGELPSTIKNCTELRVLDVGENSISGKITKWIGNHLLKLEVLRLRNNRLYDTIPFELCQLPKLHSLDLANNKLTGSIPRCFGNFSGMVMHNLSKLVRHTVYEFTDPSLQAVMKGLAIEYIENLRYLVNMDLSGNHLVGEIPLELMKLVALNGLNLSHNHLEGVIPERIGDMNALQSLDLSNNHLFGNIPESLSGLTFLSFLNLSYNNLTGEIPTGSQLQTLNDPSIYEGNPGLCGIPLSNKCHNRASSPTNAVTQLPDEDKVDMVLFCGVVLGGFASGLWATIGVFLFKAGWRHVYFKFVDDIISRTFGR